MFLKPFLFFLTNENGKTRSNISLEAVSLAQLRSYLSRKDLRLWIAARLKAKGSRFQLEVFENSDLLKDITFTANGYEEVIKNVNNVLVALEQE